MVADCCIQLKHYADVKIIYLNHWKRCKMIKMIQKGLKKVPL